MISKAYFILGSRYLRYDATADAMDAGYPKAIEGNWRGFAEIGFQSGIDAALEWPNGKVFFFKGPQYARYDIAANRTEAGYPLQIADQWTGLSTAGLADNIDAAVNWGNDKAYFFKGDRYLRYDIAGDKADDGFPRRITDGWPGFENAAFDANINTVVNWGNGKAYFFHDDRYLRYDITGDRIDEGYPQSIASGWPTVAAAGFGASIGAGWTVHGAASAHSSDFYYLSGQFFVQLKRVCQRLHCAPEDLLGVMESESGVRPDAQNPNGKATGLIQFMPSTLTSLGWSKGPDGFRSLNADQQLPFVEKYFAPHVGQGLTSAGRLYQVTFLPATLPGSSESTVIAAPGGPNASAYSANRLLDTNRDGAITVSDLTARIDHLRQGARWSALMQRLAEAV